MQRWSTLAFFLGSALLLARVAAAQTYEFEARGNASFRYIDEEPKEQLPKGAGELIRTTTAGHHHASRLEPPGVLVVVLFRLPENRGSGRLEIDLRPRLMYQSNRRYVVPGPESQISYLEKKKGKIIFRATAIEGEITLEGYKAGKRDHSFLQFLFTLTLRDESEGEVRLLRQGKVILGHRTVYTGSNKGTKKDPPSGDPAVEISDIEPVGCGGMEIEIPVDEPADPILDADDPPPSSCDGESSGSSGCDADTSDSSGCAADDGTVSACEGGGEAAGAACEGGAELASACEAGGDAAGSCSSGGCADQAEAASPRPLEVSQSRSYLERPFYQSPTPSAKKWRLWGTPLLRQAGQALRYSGSLLVFLLPLLWIAWLRQRVGQRQK